MGEALIKRRFVKSTPPTPGQLTPGETYSFGGYDWICAEVFSNYAILQSEGITAGSWPGYVMTGPTTGTGNWGSENSYYNGNIDGYDISGYDSTMSSLFNAIGFAEYQNATYGKGLYLLLNTAVNNNQYYLDALKIAAAKYQEFGCPYDGAVLGNGRVVSGTGYNGYVTSTGTVTTGGITQIPSQVIAPSFNVDLTKIKVSNNFITAANDPYDYWKVEFYSKSGNTKLYTEYVRDGENCVYGTSEQWNTQPNQTTGISGITENVTSNLVLYLASKVEIKLEPSNFTNIQFSSEYGYGNYGTMAFDGNKTYPNAWFPVTHESDSWISADFTESHELTKTNIYSASYNTPNVTLQVLGKKQDGTYENCQADTSVSYHVTDEVALNGNEYYGLKVQFTGVLVPSASSGQYTHITEIEVYGY